MSDTKKPPGLSWETLGDGSQIAWWRARRDLVRDGFRPKNERLPYAADDPRLRARCFTLQAEMVEWAASRQQARVSQYDGTFSSLVRFYETHPDSPYHELEPDTARTYSKTMALLMRNKGSRMVEAVDASDVRRWYKELVEANSKGWAYFTVNVLKAVLSFGATKRIAECRLLRVELREAKFSAGPRGKQYLTYRQVIDFRDTAHEMGLGWMALCLMLQFETGMRRRDIIGKYTRADGIDGIRNRGKLWQDGLTWGHIDAQGVLRKVVSKTRFTSAMEAIHVIADYPELAAELAKIPLERRIGPIVINPKIGRPPTEAQCREKFRKIARRAGIPDAVWQAHARSGANTEAREAGATNEESMALLTHTELKTNLGYDREQIERSRRAAAKRVASRKE